MSGKKEKTRPAAADRAPKGVCLPRADASEFNSAPLEPQRRTYRGQGYDLVGQVPYVRRDGQLTSLLVWSSCCADCGAPFEFKTPASGGRFQPNRRCSAHKRPGQRVKGDKRSLHIKETVEAEALPAYLMRELVRGKIEDLLPPHALAVAAAAEESERSFLYGLVRDIDPHASFDEGDER